MRSVSMCFINFYFEKLSDYPHVRQAHLLDFLIGEQTCQIYFDYLFREVCGSFQRINFSSASGAWLSFVQPFSQSDVPFAKIKE